MTETKVLTPQLAIELLEKAVKKRGDDYVYPKTEAGSCFYSTMERMPSCGVGWVFYRFDFSLFDNVANYERENAGSLGVASFSSTNYGRNLIPEGVELSPEAISVLKEFQALQDRGTPWGDALKSARELAVAQGYISEG